MLKPDLLNDMIISPALLSERGSTIILAMSGMCSYKYQIAFSKMGIKPEEDLQEFYVASWGGFKPVLKSKAHLKGTGTSLRGNHKQAKEGVFLAAVFQRQHFGDSYSLCVPPTFPICTA